MRRAILFATLLCLGLFVIPSLSVLSKTIVGSCCNGDSTYGAQETWSGKKLYVVGSYSEFCESPFYDWVFSVLLSDWNAGRVTHLTLSTGTSNGCNGPTPIPTDPSNYILQGHYDNEIGYFATHVLAFVKGPDGTLNTADDRRMYLRLEHELNGNWYSWSANSSAYAAAWRYVYTKVMATGIQKTHIQWVFEPISPWEVDAAHDFRLYWPGDQYVDWLSLDAYNSAGGQSWYQPNEIFDSMLYKLRDWRPNLPVMVSETGSYSDSGTQVTNKATWLSNLIPYLAKWNVQIFIYFNTEDQDWPYFQVASDNLAAPETETISGTSYRVFDTYKTAWQTYGYTLSNASSPRIMTDNEFQGRLPGYTTAPAQPQNLIIYSNGANYYDWQCTPAPYAVNLKNTAHVQSGHTYAMSLDLSAWGNVQFHSAHMGANTSDYTGLTFKIYTDINNVQISVIPFYSTGNVGNKGVTIPTAGVWTTVGPFTWSQLTVKTGVMLQGFYVQGASNNDQGTAYFDDVELIAGPVNW